MPEAQITLFIISSLIVILTPGQDFILVMSRGITRGPAAGVATASGVSVGLLGHTLLVTLGLGALLFTSDVVFTIVKYIGATYLVYLGYQLFTSQADFAQNEKSAPGSLTSCFASGALSNLSNPKITLFYFAYLPQFVPTGEESPAVLAFLGTAFALLAFVVKTTIGYASGRASSYILRRRAMLRWFSRISGTLLIGLGVRLAFEQN